MPPMVMLNIRQVSVWCNRCGGSLIAESKLAESWMRGHLDVKLDAMLVSINGGPLLWWRPRHYRITRSA